MVWQFGELGNDQSTKDANGGNDTSPKLVDWRWLDDPRPPLPYGNLRRRHPTLRMRNPELFAGRPPSLPTNPLSSKFRHAAHHAPHRRRQGSNRLHHPASTGAAVTVSCSASSISASNKQLIRASKGFEPSSPAPAQ